MNNNNKILKYTVFLLVLGIISGVLLGAVNALTSPIIEERKILAAKEALEEDFDYPSFSASKLDDTDLPKASKEIADIFYALDSEGKIVSIIYQTTSRGHHSDVSAYVEIMIDGTFGKVTMFEHDDDASWANKVVGHDFGVKNKSTDDYSPILAGATYTSQAVIDGINAAATHFKSIENPGGLTND